MSNNKRTRGAGLIELECATREEEEEWNTGRASDKGRLASEYRSGCAFLRPRGDLHRAEQFHAISSEQATLVCCWRSSWPAFLAFTRSQSFCARHGVLAVVAAHAWESAAPTRRSTELTAVRASEPLALLRSETNPTVAHTFIARPRSPPCDLISCLSQTRGLANARDRDLCHFAASATISATEIRACGRQKRATAPM
jgi:hypothetical protein